MSLRVDCVAGCGSVGRRYDCSFGASACFALGFVLVACTSSVNPGRGPVAPSPATTRSNAADVAAAVEPSAAVRSVSPIGDPPSDPAATSHADQLTAPVDPQRQSLRERDYVLLNDRRLPCKDGKRAPEPGRGVRCGPVESAIALFLSRPAQLEFVNHMFGKRHALVYFSKHATDCDVEQALCAVNGDLVSFGPQMRIGTVLFPWVENDKDLDDSMALLKKQLGVHDVTRDIEARRE